MTIAWVLLAGLAWAAPHTFAAEAISACAPAEAVTAPLHFEEQVKDPVFAALLGLLNAERFGCLSGALLANEVRRTGRKSPLPFAQLRWLVRRPEGVPGQARVMLTLDKHLRAPLPYRILWIYRPGTIWIDVELDLKEWTVGDLAWEDADHGALRLKDVHLFRFERGRGGADIDALFDQLLGARLDDMIVDSLTTFTLDGHRWGVVFGANPKGERQVGALDFTQDEIAFPMSKRMWAIARRMRSSIEARVQAQNQP
ncbi:MAG: hypothetical protein MUF51_08655 [Vicinamibacteria bacterium]|nr:hypothetical protein [Vicinamibacteria bacterium]